MLEILENGSLPFLDITISHENDGSVTSVYSKSTFSNVFRNFESFVLDMACTNVR